MEPTFENQHKKLHEHLRFLISQPIRDFQERNKVKIERVEVTLVEGSVVRVRTALNKDAVSSSLPLSEWLENTKEGRHLLMQITFPIANYFNTHPEKIPIELVVEIINTVKGNGY